MTMASATGRNEERACRTCGLTIDHTELWLQPGGLSWQAAKHTAPCGAPCMGGGIGHEVLAHKAKGAKLRTVAHGVDGCDRCETATQFHIDVTADCYRKLLAVGEEKGLLVADVLAQLVADLPSGEVAGPDVGGEAGGA
jgi:hypothetical protein